MTDDSLSNDLARHARLRGIDQSIFSQRVHLHTQLLLHEFACLSARKSVARDDRRRVDLLLDKLVRASEQFCSNQYDRRRAITDLLVLLLC